MLTYILQSKLRAILLSALMIFGLVIGILTGAITGQANAQNNKQSASPPVLPSIAVNPVPMLQMPAINRAAIAAQLVGVNCALFVPADPFSDIGLATPWQFMSAGLSCHERDVNNAAFLQATIFDPATKQFFVYPPLIIDAGTLPAIAPAIPLLPAGAVVGIWGGSNGGSVKLVGDGAGQCMNGTPQPFGQVFFCNAPAFFSAVAASGVTVPALGVGNDGQPCPTIRSFSMVDQDQSDNVQTSYLVDATGRSAQNTSTNRLLMDQTGTVIIRNPSDNLVLEVMDKALGCTPLLAPDITDAGTLVPSQALDEVQATLVGTPPEAYIPADDPMATTAGLPDLAKLNEYRLSMGQPLATTLADASTAVYCVNILSIAPTKLLLDKTAFLAVPSPATMQGDSLYTFLASRLSVTLGPVAAGGLGCTTLLGIANPVQLILNANGVAAFATIYGK